MHEFDKVISDIRLTKLGEKKIEKWKSKTDRSYKLIYLICFITVIFVSLICVFAGRVFAIIALTFGGIIFLGVFIAHNNIESTSDLEERFINRVNFYNDCFFNNNIKTLNEVSEKIPKYCFAKTNCEDIRIIIMRDIEQLHRMGIFYSRYYDCNASDNFDFDKIPFINIYSTTYTKLMLKKLWNRIFYIISIIFTLFLGYKLARLFIIYEFSSFSTRLLGVIFLSIVIYLVIFIKVTFNYKRKKAYVQRAFIYINCILKLNIHNIDDLQLEMPNSLFMYEKKYSKIDVIDSDLRKLIKNKYFIIKKTEEFSVLKQDINEEI